MKNYVQVQKWLSPLLRNGNDPGVGEGREGGVVGELRAWQLTRPTPALDVHESVAAAMEAFALHGVEALAAADGGTAVGFVTRVGLLEAVGGLSRWHEDRDAVQNIPCSVALIPFGAAIKSEDPVPVIAHAFDRTGSPLLPVVEEGGRILGCLYPSDLLAPMEQSLRLPSVGGMATPRGVYLTCDGIGGGVGSAALMATGVLMGIRVVIAGILAGWIFGQLDSGSAHIPWLGFWQQWTEGTRAVIQGVVELLLFLVLIRIGPLAGYHAAEHQTVHTLEAREPLTPARVRAKPRPHPRCGTNLMMALSVASLLYDYVASLPAKDAETGGYLLVVGLMLLFFFRVPMGGLIQQWFTTRPATGPQIDSGIRAARELMSNYAREGGKSRPFWMRLWATGLLQVGIGMGAVVMGAQGIQWAAAHLVLAFPIAAHVLPWR